MLSKCAYFLLYILLFVGFKISTPVCLTKDLPIKLSRSVKAISYDSKNKPTGIAGNDEASFALLQKKSMELIDCTVKIENMQDERVHINVTFKNASKATWVKAVREDIRRPQHHGGARPILGSSGQNKSMRGEFNSNSVSRKASATSIIAKDEILTTVIGLPSIMQADAELIEEYFHNILDNIYIEYDDHSFTYEIVLK